MSSCFVLRPSSVGTQKKTVGVWGKPPELILFCCLLLLIMRLEKLPHCYLVAVFGRFGSGKTLVALEQSIRLANAKKKSIVSNIKLNMRYLLAYCKAHRFYWLASQIESDLQLRKKQIYLNNFHGESKPLPPYRSVRFESQIFNLLHSQDSVILIDEGATVLFSRDFKESSRKNLIDRMVRVRHYGNIIILVSQNDAQIDKQFRLCFNHVIYCDSFVIGDKLLTRKAFLFDNLTFEDFRDKYQNKLITPIWKSGFRFLYRPLFLLRLLGKPREEYLFKIYDSFDGRRSLRRSVFVEYSPASVLEPSPPSGFDLSVFAPE